MCLDSSVSEMLCRNNSSMLLVSQSNLRPVTDGFVRLCPENLLQTHLAEAKKLGGIDTLGAHAQPEIVSAEVVQGHNICFHRKLLLYGRKNNKKRYPQLKNRNARRSDIQMRAGVMKVFVHYSGKYDFNLKYFSSIPANIPPPNDVPLDISIYNGQ